MDVLIISDNEQAFTAIAQVVRTTGEHSVVRASTGSSARISGLDRQFDLVIINTVNDDKPHSIATYFAQKKDCGVILLENSNHFEEVSLKFENYGIVVIEKPLSKVMLRMAIKIIIATNHRLKGFVDKNISLQNKLEEMKLVNRAKILLMQRLGYSEEQAHKHIEKTAMDMRQTRKVVAVNILRMYDS